MTDQPERGYHYNPDAPMIVSSGADGAVYAVASVGLGTAITRDSGEAQQLVVVNAANVNGHVVTVMLTNLDIDMINQVGRTRDGQ